MKFKYKINFFLISFLILNFCVNAHAFSIISRTAANNEKKHNEEDHKNDIEKPTILKKCDPCPGKIKCVAQIQCPAHVRMKSHEKPQICDLPGGKFGFCCVTGQNHTAKSRKYRNIGGDKLRHSIIEEARVKFALLLENAAGIAVSQNHPEFLHGIVFHSTPQDNLQNFQLSNSAVEEVVTSQIYKVKEQIPQEDFETNNIDVAFDSTPFGHHCPSHHDCSGNDVKYRTIDGSCNNPIPFRSLWGAAGQPIERLLPPAYEDGIWLPRMHAVDGSPLVGPREVSRILLADVSRPHPKYNLLLMQFGQFIAHDLSQTSSIMLDSGNGVDCCAADGSDMLPPEQRHYACLPILIEPHDDFFRKFNQGCINFVRLSLAPNSECKMGYAKQRSKVTHFLDASPVYGSSRTTAKELRTFRGGKLRMFNDFGRDLLPVADNAGECGESEKKTTCFSSGDGRTNQIISLVVVHILYAREHNRIADILSKINPQWTDETLYQETRRIVIAAHQHIVFNEWLPSVIGDEPMNRFGLGAQHHGYAHDYNPDVNPAVTAEFTGAALRFGHSTVDGKFHIHHRNKIDEVIDIPEVMFNPKRLRKQTFLDDLTVTLLSQPMQRVDDSVTHGLTRFLFRGDNPFGLDLAALNIQRGRDFAIRSYNDYLEVIGQQRIYSFNQFHPQLGQTLASVYKHPDDIDLWIGGLLENASDDAVVGSSFAEIIADQFSRLRHGDRYYYENDDFINPGAFSLQQLDEIRKISLARIICDNLDHFEGNEVPPFAFVQANLPGNQPLDCNSSKIPRINFELWRQ